MDKSKTATECVGYIPPRPTPEKDAYVKKLRLLQAMCDENRPASDRLAAYDELQTAMYRDKWKFERAADEEHKKAALAKVVIVTEVESKLDEFLKDREYYRTRCSHDGLAANKDYDRGLCDLIKKYIRHSLKLPTL